MNNQEFLQAISSSFNEFIKSGSSRSTAKLKPLHGAIARDIKQRLGDEYEVCSMGYDTGREVNIMGRYFDKRVDITIIRGKEVVAGIGVKFIMQNYSQNSNNYFENMLGETANIRSGNHPYFQIFIVLDKLPYYNREGDIKKWETFTNHNFQKYVTLSGDDADVYMHTPNKTLIYVVGVPDIEKLVTSKAEYLGYFAKKPCVFELSGHTYDALKAAAIMNDYKSFISKVYHTILAR